MATETTKEAPAKPEAKKVKQQKTEQPNIRFVRKRTAFVKGKEQVIECDAPKKLRNGPVTYSLPSTKEQRAGFYHKDAAAIIRLFPDTYKPIVSKGD